VTGRIWLVASSSFVADMLQVVLHFLKVMIEFSLQNKCGSIIGVCGSTVRTRCQHIARRHWCPTYGTVQYLPNYLAWLVCVGRSSAGKLKKPESKLNSYDEIWMKESTL